MTSSVYNETGLPHAAWAEKKLRDQLRKLCCMTWAQTTSSVEEKRARMEHRHAQENRVGSVSSLDPSFHSIGEARGVACFNVFGGYGCGDDDEIAATRLFPKLMLPCSDIVVDHFATNLGMTTKAFVEQYQVVLPIAARHTPPELAIAATVHGSCMSIIRRERRSTCL